MLDLLTVGPALTRPACHMHPTTRAQQSGWTAADVAIDGYVPPAPAAADQLYIALAIDRRDRQTRTDARPF